MMTLTTFNAETLVQRCRELRERRESQKTIRKRQRVVRKALSKAQRAIVLQKTDGRCHICGGEISGRWQADHVMAHSAGGEHVTENYLPAHATCNNYRWDYLPEEFELILKLGVWARTEVEQQTPAGRQIAQKFGQKESQRQRRKAR